MSFKETIYGNIIPFLLALLLFQGCASHYSESLNTNPSGSDYVSRYLVPNQLPAPQSIKSVQLYRSGNKNSPPIIQLGTNQKLTLTFDELSDLGGQFRLRFTHHDQNWNNSNIPTDWYMIGFNEMTIGGGLKNRLSKPDYFHYRAEFPNDQVNFKTSGNYMLHVYDFSSGVQLFSLPFFVTENEGELTSSVETDYNAGPRNEAMDRPFSTFVYSDFIEFPQFDLSFYFVQNRFWGDTRKSENYDFSESDRSQFHLSSQKAYYSNFDFIGLNITNFSVDGRKILDWQPAALPPRIILREDVLNFSSDPVFGWGSNFGNPVDQRDARYASVLFRFQDSGEFTAEDGVYLVGDFNQWVLSDNNKLHYNTESGYWEASVLIKQGTYTYKYALKNGTNGIDDVKLSDTITRQQQEYISLVYFNDPDYRYQRLLQAQVFRSEGY